MNNAILDQCEILQIAFPGYNFAGNCCSAEHAMCENGKIIGLYLGPVSARGVEDPYIKVDLNRALLYLKQNSGQYKFYESLKYIKLNGLQLPSFPKEICQIRNLSYFNIKDSLVPGELPECLGTLSKLTVISMENLALKGTIPSSISNLKNLEFLKLNGNMFSGTLPSFTDLKNIKQIQISGSVDLEGPLKATFPKIKSPYLNHNGPRSFSSTCDFSGTAVCTPTGYKGPKCFIPEC